MNRDSVEAWLKEYGVENYTINEDLSVDVDGDFYCNANNLTSLEGCPSSVGGGFNCGNNRIGDSELFLYSYSSDQVRQYYNGKDLNKRLLVI